VTPEQRFQEIEVTIQAIGESQLCTQASFEGIMRAQTSTRQAVAHMRRFEENLDGYGTAADARMRWLEENLDGLIRAIMAEHSNGKSHN
jgi:hypothetical protein